MNLSRLSPVLLLLALSIPLAAEDGPAPQPAPVPQPTAEVPAPTPPEPPAASETLPQEGRITLDFRGARLGQVLDLLSKEAGFIVINPIELATPITLVAKQPLTPAEAVDALNGVLFDQGYTAITRGRTLRVVPLAAARVQSLPVSVGADPQKIPETDRMVTQIIPVSYATAKDLVDNLQPLLAGSATLSANESSNSLLMTDTQSNIRRIAAIVQAIDSSIFGEQQVKVFHLVHADADKVTTVINNIYGKSSTTSRNQAQDPFSRMMAFGRGGQGGAGGGGNAAGATATDSKGGRGGDVVAAADSGTNSVVIRASVNALETLARVVSELDVDTSAHDGVLVYQVRNGKAADLATSLNTLFQGTQTTTSTTSTTAARNGGANRQTTAAAAPAMGGGGAAASASGGGDAALDLSGQVRVVADATSNSVLVLSPERNFERLRKILVELDQPMRQVLIRVLVAEVTLENGLDLGVQMQGINPNGTAVGIDSGTTTNSSVSSEFNLFDSNLGLNGFMLNSRNFTAAIRALATNTRFDVLARPYVLTTDNREAVVNVSQTVPIINGTRTDTNNNVTTTFDRQDVGIILTVTPQINNEGRVVLDVNQELTALTDQGIPVAPDVQSPIIKKRSMTTRVAVDKGQTVVVGGLVHDSLTETVRKIPWLGDIPWIGALFRRTTKTQGKTELLVFLTPQVVMDASELGELTRKLHGEMQTLDTAVDKELLKRHLDQLDGLKLDEPLPPAPMTPSRTLSPEPRPTSEPPPEPKAAPKPEAKPAMEAAPKGTKP